MEGRAEDGFTTMMAALDRLRTRPAPMRVRLGNRVAWWLLRWRMWA